MDATSREAAEKGAMKLTVYDWQVSCLVKFSVVALRVICGIRQLYTHG